MKEDTLQKENHELSSEDLSEKKMEEAAAGEKPAEKAGKPAENPAGKAVEESAEKQSAELAEKTVEEPAEAQSAEPAEKTVEESAEKQSAEPVEKAMEEPAEKQSAEPAEKAGMAVEESAEKQSAEPAEKAVEKPAEAQPAESAEKAVEEPAEKLPGTTAVAGGERKNTDENSKHDAGAAAGKSQDSPGAAAGSQSPDSAGAAAGRHTQGSLKEFAVGSSPVDPPQPPRKRSSAGRIAFLLSLLTILLVLGGIYYYGYQYCGTHFMPGTRINLFDCSGLTEDEVHERFAEAAENYVINVRFRGGATEMLSAKDIGFTYQPDGSIAALLQEQDQMLWPKYFFEENGYTIDVGGNYDDDKLMDALQTLPELQKDNMEEPENAYIRFRDGKGDEDGAFEIVPDTPGSKIDAIQLAAAVGDAAARYEEMLDAEEIEGVYISADVPADDTKLVTRCKDLNEIVGASITYVMPDGEEIKLNADVMKNWLVEDKKGRLVKDDDVWDQHLWDFLQELANHGNTLGMNRQFNSSLRGQITVTGGDYGYMVNQIVEHDLLVEDLPANKKETRKPSYYLTPYNEETENDGIGTSYIEVDLAAQHIWCYINGELKMESDCVSGMTSDGHATPTGVFGIMFMKKDATLRGIMQKNGKYEYETKVAYWMPFYDGCGFHDAWWRTAFGGDIYIRDGSHGCINLPVDAAKELFSYCDVKMPVVVYE